MDPDEWDDVPCEMCGGVRGCEAGRMWIEGDTVYLMNWCSEACWQQWVERRSAFIAARKALKTTRATLKKETTDMSDALDLQPRCVKLLEEADNSVKFARGFLALMADLAASRITPQAGNAICNAGGKVLKVVEMQMKYGTNGPGQKKVLELTDTQG